MKPEDETEMLDERTRRLIRRAAGADDGETPQPSFRDEMIAWGAAMKTDIDPEVQQQLFEEARRLEEDPETRAEFERLWEQQQPAEQGDSWFQGILNALRARPTLGWVAAAAMLVIALVPYIQMTTRGTTPTSAPVLDVSSQLSGGNRPQLVLGAGPSVNIDLLYEPPLQTAEVYWVEILRGTESVYTVGIPGARLRDHWDKNRSRVRIQVPSAALSEGQYELKFTEQQDGVKSDVFAQLFEVVRGP